MAGHRPPVIWSPEAEADLTDIWNYFASAAGHGVADKVAESISETCQMLREHPRAGRARDEVRPGLRSVISGPYVIFYRVRGDVAELVRILDGRRDIEEVFE